MRAKTLLEAELAQKNVIAVLPGGYHPFHQGHLALYNAAVKKFGADNVYVAATDDTSERPFPFSIKKKLARAAGVPADRFIQVQKPFNLDQYTQLAQDPNNTVLVFVRSEKDKFEHPLPGNPDAVVTRGPRKGLPPALLGLSGKASLQKPMTQHGYLDYLPTVQFKAGNRKVTSASEVRAEWPNADDSTKDRIVADLYPMADPKTHAIIKGLLDQALNAQAELAEDSVEEDFYGAVEFHDSLNPALWDGKNLHDDVGNKLDDVAKYFVDYLDTPAMKVVDVTISGSNAAFTYTKHSDIDLHLIVEVPEELQDLYRKFFDAKKKLFNDEHNIRIKGQPVEVYVQFADQPHVSAGIYSLMNRKWLSTPKKEKAQASHSDVKSKASHYVYMIDDAIRNKDVEAANKIWDRIKQDRKEGLADSGEFGTENLVYKLLRNVGFLDLLNKFMQETVSQELSLKETGL